MRHLSYLKVTVTAEPHQQKKNSMQLCPLNCCQSVSFTHFRRNTDKVSVNL